MKWRLAVLVGVIATICGAVAHADDTRGQQLQYTVRGGDSPAELAAQFGLDPKDLPVALVSGKRITLPFVRMDYAEKLARELADRERALIAMSDKSHALTQENTKLTGENARLVAEEARMQGLEQNVSLFKWAFGAVSVVAGIFLVVLLLLVHVNRSGRAIIKEIRAKNVWLTNATFKAEEKAAREAVKTKPQPVRSISAGA